MYKSLIDVDGEVIGVWPENYRHRDDYYLLDKFDPYERRLAEDRERFRGGWGSVCQHYAQY